MPEATHTTSALERPIFIGGLFKTGTTLLRAMLGRHPNIASGLETYWFRLDWANRDSDEMQTRLARLAALLDFDPSKVKAMAAECGSRTQFLDRFMTNIAAREGKPRWAEKTPGNVFHMPEIFAHWPDAQVLYVMRDPRDIYVSMREANRISGPLAFAEQWVAFASAVEAARAEGLCSNERFMKIKYENLVLKTRETFGAILDFLNEPWDEGAANFDGQSGDYEKVLQVMKKKSTTLIRLKEGMTSSRIGIWRDGITARDLKVIETRIDALGMIDDYRKRCVDTL